MGNTDRTKLGDQMKMFEHLGGSHQRLMPKLPAIARLDGKAFHTFCKGLEKPFDSRFQSCMEDTTRYLVKETHALLGYTQSDEISLLWYQPDPKSQIFMDGKVHKINSILAGMTSVMFSRLVTNAIPEKENRVPCFDCRTFNVPTLYDVDLYFLWRERDATRNSISGLAQKYFSPEQLHKKNSKDKMEMLHTKDINWNNLPPNSKRGSYFRRVVIERMYSSEELDKLPKLHEARSNPSLMIKRTVVEHIVMPPISKVENFWGIIVDGAAPKEKIQ